MTSTSHRCCSQGDLCGRVPVDAGALEDLVRLAHRPVVDAHPLISTIDEELLDTMTGACLCGVDYAGSTDNNAAAARLQSHIRDQMRQVGL